MNDATKENGDLKAEIKKKNAKIEFLTDILTRNGYDPITGKPPLGKWPPRLILEDEIKQLKKLLNECECPHHFNAAKCYICNENEGNDHISHEIQKPLDNEITIELTNYCPHGCKYCSSNTTSNTNDAKWIDIRMMYEFIADKHFKRIILSGGEPLAHPSFYDILMLVKLHADDVVVYTNALTHICYNANIIDGIYIAANITVNNNVKKVKILKRVKQGKESTRPEVSFSGNFDGKCPCNSPVMLPDGTIVESPCKKEKTNKNIEYKQLKEHLELETKKMKEMQDKSKWHCSTCNSYFIEPLVDEFGNHDQHCPFCSSTIISEEKDD